MIRKFNNILYTLSAIILILINYSIGLGNVYEHLNWKYHYPPGAAQGLFLAIALPLEMTQQTTYLAYSFEGVYGVPTNQTHFQYPPLVQRKFVYDAIESKIQSNGYYGKGCLLRVICEASKEPIHESTGVLGNLIHILLTPSTSKDANMTSEYQQAEILGREKQDCTTYNKNCSISFLDLFTTLTL